VARTPRDGRSGEQFNVYICDRFVVPALTARQQQAEGGGRWAAEGSGAPGGAGSGASLIIVGELVDGEALGDDLPQRGRLYHHRVASGREALAQFSCSVGGVAEDG
jgi:hypothetical protein